jgi:beta-glucosidase
LGIQVIGEILLILRECRLKANLFAHRGRRVHFDILLWRRCAFSFLVVVAASTGSRGATGEAPPSVEPNARSLESFDDVANQLLGRMTLAEKIGQMTQAELGSLGDLSDVSRLALGSVLCGGGSDPRDGNSVDAWAGANDACQKQALASRLKVPLLFGIDAMHGHSNVLGAVIFPHNVGLGCTRDVDLVESIGRITAEETRATGINWAFAPCITAPQDDRWGRAYEGYSEDSTLSGSLGAALVQGLQSGNLSDPAHVLACAKHFAGDGGTSAEMRDATGFGEGRRFALDQGDTRLEEKPFRAVHVSQYVPSIEAGVGTVMVSYSSWNGLKCTANKYLLTDVLKTELGFQGLVISDYNAIAQTDPDFKTAIKKSINAGIDMAMEPNKYREFITHLTALVEEGDVSMERIDDAVLRILRVKAAMGLLGDSPNVMANRELQQQFGSAEHRSVARRAVSQSLVLLKNEGHVLPLARSAKRIHVAGRGADDIGMQCGGWTIDWQGKAGNVTTGGTTILAAIRQTAGDTKVTHSVDASNASGADVAIVVVGEQPYAEGFGDDPDLSLDEADLATIRRVKEAGVPMVLVVLSGRPLILGEALEAADAVVAAWLPGTEGAGVADVLFGDIAPSGKLSFTWPKSVEQVPINAGDAEYDPLFPFGFGLTYSK